MNNFRFKARREQVELMHKLILSSNDEGIYSSWVYLMPDEPTLEDFDDFANSDKLYNELVEKFKRLIKLDGWSY